MDVCGLCIAVDGADALGLALGVGGVVVFMSTCWVEGAVGRSEWSAKRERSEREADHERRQL